MICAGQEVCAVILVSEQAAIILKTMKIIQRRDYTQKNIAESTSSIIEKNLTCMKSEHILRVESILFQSYLGREDFFWTIKTLLTIVKGLSMSVVSLTVSFSATESFFLFRLTCLLRLFCSFFLLLLISFWLSITAYTIREPGIRFTKLICNGFVSVFLN